MNSIPRPQVFLSYAHEDLQLVRKLHADLRERGVNTWFDKVDLKPGRWATQIQREIARSQHFLICLSDSTLRKTGDTPGFQDEELNAAYMIARDVPSSEFTILPVRLSECGRGDHRISSFQQYDLFPDWNAAVDRIAEAVGGKGIHARSPSGKSSVDSALKSALLGKLEVLYIAGDYSRASQVQAAAIDLLNAEEQAILSREPIVLKLGSYEHALSHFKQKVALAEERAMVWRMGVRDMNAAGLPHYARIQYFSVEYELEACGKDLFKTGNELAEQGNIDAAIAAYDMSAKVFPAKAPVPLTNKGIVLLRSDRVEAALEAFEDALVCRRPLAETWKMKAEALQRLNRHDEAEKALRSAQQAQGRR